MLTREWPMVPPISMPLIDVRDVALAHIKAMKVPAAAGNHILHVNLYSWMCALSRLVGWYRYSSELRVKHDKIIISFPFTTGHRHILTNGTYWLKEMSGMLADEFNPKGMITKQVSNFNNFNQNIGCYQNPPCVHYCASSLIIVHFIDKFRLVSSEKQLMNNCCSIEQC